MQSVSREELLQELESVSIGIATKELLEQSSAFVFHKGRIITFNDEITASIPTKLKIEGVIQAEPFYKMVKKIKEEEIKVAQEGSIFIIRGKDFQAKFNSEKEIIIPIDEINIPKKFKKLPTGFSKAIRMVCITAGKALSEPLLMNVHIENNKIESCDNDRVTICTLDKNLKMDILVSAKNIGEINKQEVNSIASSDGWIHFKTKKGAILSSRLIDEDYIDLEQYVPTQSGKPIVFPTQIKDLLDKGEIFSQNEISTEKLIKIRLKDGKLDIMSQNSTGKYRGWKKVKYFGPDLTFEINPDFLRDILSLSHKVSIVDNTLMFEEEDAVHVINLEG